MKSTTIGASRDAFERRQKHDAADNGRHGVALGAGGRCGAATSSGLMVGGSALMTCRASAIGGGAGPAGPRRSSSLPRAKRPIAVCLRNPSAHNQDHECRRTDPVPRAQNPRWEIVDQAPHTHLECNEPKSEDQHQREIDQASRRRAGDQEQEDGRPEGNGCLMGKIDWEPGKAADEGNKPNGKAKQQHHFNEPFAHCDPPHAELTRADLLTTRTRQLVEADRPLAHVPWSQRPRCRFKWWSLCS
jgi:hypothetical protein